ncbi:MAG TPA: hypothetical protein VEX41_10945, partial [Candidatus Eisenbacteria bacterium]|nr:hypothetical protein [Candidatus Eisenbacteria bacterium]
MDPDSRAENPGEPAGHPAGDKAAAEPAAAEPGTDPSPPPPEADGPSPTPIADLPDDPPSIRQQIGATFEALKRLVRAHIALARAEAGEIAGEVKRMVALAGAALGAFIALGLLLAVGLPLFLGELLFGSIGWGVLLGAVLLFDFAIAAVLLALDVTGSRLARDFVVAAVIGSALGVVLGFDLTHRAWTTFGESLAPSLDPGT